MIVTFQFVYFLLKEIVKALLFTSEEDQAEILSGEHPVDVGPKLHVKYAQGEKGFSIWETFRRRRTTCSTKEKLSFTFGSRLLCMVNNPISLQ